MTLKEMKNKVLRLIEETSTTESKLTDDPDIELKLNDVINQIMFELARFKKIPTKKTETITVKELELTKIDNFYQLNTIRFKDSEGNYTDYDIFENLVVFPTEGTADIYYYKYPKRITDDTKDNEYKFELSDDALECMPYGVAADLLKSDVSNQYGQIYANRYEQMKQVLDPRYSMGSISFEGGLDI